MTGFLFNGAEYHSNKTRDISKPPWINFKRQVDNMAWKQVSVAPIGAQQTQTPQAAPSQGVMNAFHKKGFTSVGVASDFGQAVPTVPQAAQAPQQNSPFRQIVQMAPKAQMPQAAPVQQQPVIPQAAPSPLAGFSSIWGNDERAKFLDQMWKNRGF